MSRNHFGCCVLPTKTKFLALTLLMAITTSAVDSQEKTAPARRYSAPHFTGELVGTDGARQLVLQSSDRSGFHTFVGSIHSACMVPVNSNPHETRPLDLSAIPKRTVLTVFYIRHSRKQIGVEPSENIVLAVRFDHLKAPDPTLPEGTVVPCFK